MEMPVIVGVIITVAFLVSFSEWFYTLCKGISVVVLDDIFYVYRIIGMSLVSLLFMIGVFAAIAIVKECPNENREGIFLSGSPAFGKAERQRSMKSRRRKGNCRRE